MLSALQTSLKASHVGIATSDPIAAQDNSASVSGVHEVPSSETTLPLVHHYDCREILMKIANVLFHVEALYSKPEMRTPQFLYFEYNIIIPLETRLYPLE